MSPVSHTQHLSASSPSLRPRSPRRFALMAQCGLWATLLFSGPIFAADAQQALEAIRAALVNAAREAPTRVMSMAWIDEQGALREDTFFHSAAQVRGVRVSSYLEDGADRPTLKATAQIALPAHVLALARPAPPPAGGPGETLQSTECAAPPAGAIKPPMALSLSAQAGARRDDVAVIGLLTRAAQGWWLRDAPQASRWHPVGRAQVAALDGRDGPPILVAGSEQGYRRAFLGVEHPPAPWVTRVRLTAPAESSQPWQVRIRLERTSDGTEVLTETRNILPPQTREAFAGLTVLSGLQEILTAWLAQADARLACEAPLFEAHPTAGADWTVAVGVASGLKVGQRMLLLDRTRIPARWAEPEGLTELGMAEVAAVNAHHTTLRWLAGPRQPAQGAWVALPL
jgi:hypothetical protein